MVRNSGFVSLCVGASFASSATTSARNALTVETLAAGAPMVAISGPGTGLTGRCPPVDLIWSSDSRFAPLHNASSQRGMTELKALETRLHLLDDSLPAMQGHVSG